MSGNRTAPEFLPGSLEELVRKNAQVLNGVMQGEQNNDFTTTLRGTPEVTTEIVVPFAKPGQHVILAPSNAASALDFSLGTTFAVAENGKITIHHAAGGTDREYGALLQG